MDKEKARAPRFTPVVKGAGFHPDRHDLETDASGAQNPHP